MIQQLVTIGASITQSPWYTWKDYLEISSGLDVIDLSSRGVGNTYMVFSLLQQSLMPNSLIVVMLTSIDKFDWFVEDERLESLRHEKHRPIPVDHRSGFWCTGSWFPGEKEIYKRTFFSLDWMCSQTINSILLFKEVAKNKNCEIEFFFDSPIWNYTEQDLNEICLNHAHLPPRRLLDLSLSSQWVGMLDNALTNDQDASLIGYCWKNKLPWANQLYKTHPPSSSHWKFYNDVMRPQLSRYINLDDVNLEAKIQTMDELWHNC